MANEKVISTQALIDKFKQALAEKWGYIWGTAGETWTAAKQANLEKTTDADRANSRKYGSKWIGHKVADCSGLFSWAFKQLGGYMYHGSDTMFRKYCTRTGELKNGHPAGGGILPVGVAVFTYNKDKKKYGHVGLYVGGGFVIEARGAYYGVVMTKIESRPWVAWGELKGVDYSNETPAPEPTPEPVKRPTIRKGNRNAYVKEIIFHQPADDFSLQGLCPASQVSACGDDADLVVHVVVKYPYRIRQKCNSGIVFDVREQ